MNRLQISALLATMRPPFLTLTVVSIFYASAIASTMGAGLKELNYWHVFLAFAGALCAHIAVNTLNEYLDFKSGLDTQTTRTPFSGGSGALVAHPSVARYTLALAICNCIVCFTIGIYFAIVIGLSIIPIGTVGLVTVVLYTRVLNKQAFLCWLSPGVGFGVLMVLGTVFVLTNTITLYSISLTIFPFLLVNNLLLLNQLPDIDADRAHGRYHLAIKYGVGICLKVYLATWISLLVLTLVYMYLNKLEPLNLLASLCCGVGIYTYSKLRPFDKNDFGTEPKINKIMGLNIALCHLIPVIIALSLLF